MSDLVPAPWISELGDYRCHAHPTRPVQSVCRGCARPLCVECATRVDGLNRCADCVRGSRPAVTHPGSRAGWKVLRALGVALTFLLFGVLAAGFAFGWPLIWGMRQINANEDRMVNLRYGLHSFYEDNGRWPTSKEGLKVLMEPPEDLETWDGPYVWIEGDLIRDPETGDMVDVFGRPVYYWTKPDEEKAYIASAGPNGEFDSDSIGSDSPVQLGDDKILWTDDMSYLSDEEPEY